MKILPLADQPQWVSVLARQHFATWGRDLPWWSLDQAQEELEAHARQGEFPTTLVAVEGEELLGSASLVREDLPAAELPQGAGLGSWLASVFVIPEHRRRGIGSALVNAIVKHAFRLGFETIYLFTASHEIYYQRLGWELSPSVEPSVRTSLDGSFGVVMMRSTAEVPQSRRSKTRALTCAGR